MISFYVVSWFDFERDCNCLKKQIADGEYTLSISMLAFDIKGLVSLKHEM